MNAIKYLFWTREKKRNNISLLMYFYLDLKSQYASEKTIPHPMLKWTLYILSKPKILSNMETNVSVFIDCEDKIKQNLVSEKKFSFKMVPFT